MITSSVTATEKDKFNVLASHPLQSWEWGEFRKKTGVTVERLGFYQDKKLIAGLQITFHIIPYTNYTVGYVPKGQLPNEEQLSALREIGKKHNAIFIQLEPNVTKFEIRNPVLSISNGSTFKFLRSAAHPLFTKYTFYLDLAQSEEVLLKNMHPKTRYNIRVAERRGVTIQEENTPAAFAAYLALTQETTQRQKFYAHTPEYHRLMWESLHPPGIAHLLTARYQGEILTTWIVFLFNNVLYYPYGASTEKHKEVMASNLMMWEAIRFGKKHGAKIFDLWGTPGPNPTPKDPYYGFHKFKLGYNPQLIEFIGSFDLILIQPQYQLFTTLDKFRWWFLKLKARIS